MYEDEFESYRAEGDPRLLDVRKELKRLRDAIDNLEWQGEDASHLYPAYRQIKKEHEAGREFVPVF